MTDDLKALNSQAIQAARRHMNAVAWPTVGLTVLVLLGYSTNLALFAVGFTPAWLALLVLAGFTHLAYTPVHEAVHGNINGANENLKWLNQLCGYIGAQMSGNPFSSHRFEHLTHHRHTNHPENDPDYVSSEIAANPFIAFWAMLKFGLMQISYFTRHHWSDSTLRQKSKYIGELLIGLSWRVAVITLVSEPGIFVVLIGGSLLGGAFTVYWFSYRPHHPYDTTARYQNTNSLIMPAWMKPVKWFWLGQELHSIHHLFPKVPFYRYEALHNEIEPIMRAHGTPILGLFSREDVSP